MKRFTLNELIIVIITIAILAAIILLNISKVKDRALDTAYRANEKEIQTAVDRYYLDHGLYPTDPQPKKDSPELVIYEKIVPEYIKKEPKQDFEVVVDEHGTVKIKDKEDNKNTNQKNIVDQIIQIASGEFFSTVLLKDGTVKGWGSNWNYELAIDDEDFEFSSEGVTYSNLKDIKEIASGGGFGVALSKEGNVYAWGYNYGKGQIGQDFSIWDVPTPTQINGLPIIKNIAVGTSGHHVLALSEDGDVYAWGNNNLGQVGDGTRTNTFIPKKVPNLPIIKSIAAGQSSSFAISESGELYTWGLELNSEVANYNYTYNTTPVLMENMNNVKSISTTYSNSAIALMEDGTIMTWGLNESGELGDGTLNNRDIPEKISDLNNIKEISVGDNHVLALTEDGKVWSWGSNWDGQIGIGTNDQSIPTPFLLEDLPKIKMISAGGYFSIAIAENGEIWSWGSNEAWQLGLVDYDEDGYYNEKYVVPVLAKDLFK